MNSEDETKARMKMKTRITVAFKKVIVNGVRVDAFYEDGQAYVWDNVAGHFTTCHSLTENQVAYVRRRANRDVVVSAGKGVTTLNLGQKNS